MELPSPRSAKRSLRAEQTVLEWKSSDRPLYSEQPSVDLSFRLVNDGDRVVKIRSVESSCGCTKTSLSSAAVPPGGGVDLKASVTTFPFGEKRILIKVNCDPRPSVHWN